MSKEMLDSDKKAGRIYWERTRVGNGVILEDKRVQLNKKVILEIGPGESPFYIEGRRSLKGGEYYLGVDRNPYRCRWDLNPAITADARRLPLRDGSAKEIVICNVAGDPRVEDEVGEIIKEAGRVLDPGGEIVVVETYSPFITPIRRLEELMQENGLELKNRRCIYDKKEIDQYAKSGGSKFAYVAKFFRPQYK